jgi:tRNA(Ile)-lysidine synthase
VNNVKVLRPLINIEKNELKKLSKKVFKYYVKDPSNYSDNFKRIRLRKLLKKLEIEGLDKKKLQLTIKNLKESNKTINFYIIKNIKENSVYSKINNRYVLSKNFFEQSKEVTFRSLIDLMKIVSQRYYPPRGRSVNEVILKIRSNKLKKVTLGGCLIEKINETVFISSEKHKKNQI